MTHEIFFKSFTVPKRHDAWQLKKTYKSLVPICTLYNIQYKTCWSLVSYLCMWGIWNCPFVQYLIVSFHWSLHLLLQIRCMSCSNWSPSSFCKISPNCCRSKTISSYWKWSLLSRNNNLSIKKNCSPAGERAKMDRIIYWQQKF